MVNSLQDVFQLQVVPRDLVFVAHFLIVVGDIVDMLMTNIAIVVFVHVDFDIPVVARILFGWDIGHKNVFRQGFVDNFRFDHSVFDNIADNELRLVET